MTTSATAGEHYTKEELIQLWNDYMIEGARYGDVADVMEALANDAEVDAQDTSGRTALHMAAANAHLEVAEVLLKAGANTEAKNDAGNTALHWACISQSAGPPESASRGRQPPNDATSSFSATCHTLELMQIWCSFF
jgi:ankyrin repeat protein